MLQHAARKGGTQWARGRAHAGVVKRFGGLVSQSELVQWAPLPGELGMRAWARSSPASPGARHRLRITPEEGVAAAVTQGIAKVQLISNWAVLASS